MRCRTTGVLDPPNEILLGRPRRDILLQLPIINDYNRGGPRKWENLGEITSLFRAGL